MAKKLLYLFVALLLAVLGLFSYHRSQIAHLFPIKATFSVANASVYPDVTKTTFKALKAGDIHILSDNIWVKIEVGSHRANNKLVLELSNPHISGVYYYNYSAKGLKLIHKAGAGLPFGLRPISSSTVAFPVQWYGGPFYLKILKSEKPIHTKIKLWHENDFENHEQRYYFLWGIFAGLVFLVVLINTLFWLSTFDAVYIWFTLCVLALAFRQLIETGLGFQFVWPNYPIINRFNSNTLAFFVYLFFLIQFQHHFFALTKKQRKFYTLGFWVKIALVFCATSNIFMCLYPKFFQNNWSFGLEVLSNIFCGSLLIIWFFNLIKIAYSSGQITQRLYILGFSLQLLLQFYIFYVKSFDNQPQSLMIFDAYFLLLLIFSIDLLFFSCLLAYRYRETQQQNSSLTLQLLQQNNQTNDKLILALAQERKQIHNLLEHEVGAPLKAIAQGIALIKNEYLVHETSDLLHKLLGDVHSIVHNINPTELLNAKLEKVLAEHINHLNKSQSIRFNFRKSGENHLLNKNQEIQLYRIANELINNIIKHSKAEIASLELSFEANGFGMLVDDDGQGFDYHEKIEQTDGIGLKNIRARCFELGATLEFLPKNNGTSVLISLKYTN